MQREPGKRGQTVTVRARWVVAAATVVGLGAAGVAVANEEPKSSFCTADALLGPNGETYGRRHPDCSS